MAECESGRENACGIGIGLMSNKKQGVGVMWRGNNGGERDLRRGYADNYGAKSTV